MRFISTSLLAVYMILISACASSSLQVQSEPTGADVYLKSSRGSFAKIGQTPLQVGEAQVVQQGESFQLTVSKDGYSSEHVVVPPSHMSRATSISVRLKENAKSSNNEENLDKVAGGVAQIQQMIRLREFERAAQTLLVYSTQYPSVSTFHELLGNVYYLQKDLGKALQSYKKAAELNPRNLDTQNMIQRLSDYKGTGT